MITAVPDPTVEALSEAERAQLEANFGKHQRLNSQGVCATCHGMGAVLAILAEHTERAVREALEAAAVRVETIEPVFVNRGPQRMYAFNQAKMLAARIIREGIE